MYMTKNRFYILTVLVWMAVIGEILLVQIFKDGI